MDYLIFLSPSSEPKKEVITLLAGYNPKNPIVISEGKNNLKAIVEAVSRAFHCEAISTPLVSFNFNRGEDLAKESSLVLSYLLEKQKEKDADAVIFVAKESVLYYVDKEVRKKFKIDPPLRSTSAYYESGEIRVFDLKKGIVHSLKNLL